MAVPQRKEFGKKHGSTLGSTMQKLPADLTVFGDANSYQLELHSIRSALLEPGEMVRLAETFSHTRSELRGSLLKTVAVAAIIFAILVYLLLIDVSSLSIDERFPPQNIEDVARASSGIEKLQKPAPYPAGDSELDSMIEKLSSGQQAFFLYTLNLAMHHPRLYSQLSSAKSSSKN